MQTTKLTAFTAILIMGLMLAGCGNKATVVEPAETVDADMPVSEALGEGQVIAETLCASCHAVGLTGESPHQDAPAFHALGARYPIENLAEPLAEGIMVGHPDMPEFQFEANEVNALITYIESLQPSRD